MWHFPCPRLGLSDCIITLDARKKGTLLDSRGLLENVGVDSMQEGLGEVHVIKAVHDLIPVTQNDTFGLYPIRAIVSGSGILTCRHDP